MCMVLIKLAVMTETRTQRWAASCFRHSGAWVQSAVFWPRAHPPPSDCADPEASWRRAAQVVGAVGWGHARLPLPDGVHPVLRALIARCFDDPAERPSFSDILDMLKPLQTPLAAAAAAATAAAAASPRPGTSPAGAAPAPGARPGTSPAGDGPGASVAAAAAASLVAELAPLGGAADPTLAGMGAPGELRAMLGTARSAAPVLSGVDRLSGGTEGAGAARAGPARVPT